ncbi:hypothetical protein C4569_01305 [Candidatus Parcubacteria bacterium]|nr:MAG: hypothetical protein C4569_01305 [Candidatus Parcubacteria bacterium]
MPEENVKSLPINVNPAMLGLTGVNIGFTEEEFRMLLIVGNQAAQYLCSPKHAKRIMLLFQKVVADYEKKFGELKTKLPEGAQTVKQDVGFDVNRSKE